jgi:hypothetical protein
MSEEREREKNKRMRGCLNLSSRNAPSRRSDRGAFDEFSIDEDVTARGQRMINAPHQLVKG